MEASKVVHELPPNFRLFRGGHSPPVPGQPLELCFDETIAWMFGEGHTASPVCMCPVLAGYGMRINDRFDDDERQLLIRLLARCGGTRSTREVERKRAYSLVDASIREISPIAMARWPDLADRMRALSPVVDSTSARAAREACREIRAKARNRAAAAAAATAAADAYAYATAAAAAYAYATAAAAAYATATAAADAAAAAYAAATAYAAADAYAYADAYAKRLSAEDLTKIRAIARRPIVEATIRAFERSIEIEV